MTHKLGIVKLHYEMGYKAELSVSRCRKSYFVGKLELEHDVSVHMTIIIGLDKEPPPD